MIDILETDVRVYDQQAAEHSIERGIQRATNEWGDGDGYERN